MPDPFFSEGNRFKTSKKDRDRALEQAKAEYEDRLQVAQKTTLPDLRFSPEEQLIQEQLEAAFSEAAQQSEGNSQQFLILLRNRGVAVIHNSNFFRFIAELKRRRGRLYDEDLTTPQASYVSHQGLIRLEESLAKIGIPLEVQEELLKVKRASNGVVFFQESPSPLVVWHEGAHALQFIAGWKQEPGPKAKTEVGINLALLKAYGKDLLTDVTSEGFFIIDTGFKGVMIHPENNNIFKELEDFERDMGKIQ